MHGRPFPAPDDTSPLTLAPARTSPHAELCTSFGRQSPVKTFTDDKGWVPGFALNEVTGQLYYRDRDASTVVPSVGNQQYSTPLYDLEGNRLPAYDGEDIGLGPFGSGNPAVTASANQRAN